MRNCLVFGSRRSGSSLVVGALARAGYHVGETYSQPTAEHPAGSFDAEDIGAINDSLLLPHISLKDRYRYERRWLALPDGCVEPTMESDVREAAEAVLAQSPWCFCDSRFCFTLPAWRPLLSDVGLVCVFKHPADSVAGMVEECGGSIEIEHAFDVWTATYREILERESEGGRWLFVHNDQLGEERGRRRLSEFLGTRIEAEDSDLGSGVPSTEFEAPEEALEIYEELCRRVGRSADEGIEDDVAVLSIIDDSVAADVPALIENISEQHGVRARIYLIDATRDRILRSADPNTVVLLARSVARGRWIRDALLEIAEPFVAFARADCPSFKTRLALGRRELKAGAHAVTCDYTLVDGDTKTAERAHADANGEGPGPFWESGLMARREALASMSTEAFAPIELELLYRLRSAGLTAHVSEPGFAVLTKSFVSAIDRAREEREFVAIRRGAGNAATRQPLVTVSIDSVGSGMDWMDCLESFCRQIIAPGSFEVVITHTTTDRSVIDRVRAARLDVDYPVPVRHVDCAGANASAARNRALSVARGSLVVFVDTDTVAPVQFVEQHLEAHSTGAMQPSERSGGRLVTGPLDEPAEACDFALNRHLQSATFASRKRNENPLELSLANMSAPLDSLCEIGGFDEAMERGAAVDLGLRLRAIGCEPIHAPRIRARRRVATTFDSMRERTRRAGQESIRLGLKHPSALHADGTGLLDANGARALFAQSSSRRVRLEGALDELGSIDIGALEALGQDYTPVAERVLRDLDTHMPELIALWHNEGQLAGFQTERIESLAEVVAPGEVDWPVWTRSKRKIFAWPDWRDESSLRRVIELFEPAAELGGTALILAYDERVDGSRDDAVAQIEKAYARTFSDDTEVEVVLEEAHLGPAELLRIGRTVNAVLRLGSEPERFFDLVIAEALASREAVESWTDRFREPQNTRAELAPESKLRVSPEAAAAPKPVSVRGSRGTRRDSSHPSHSSSEGE